MIGLGEILQPRRVAVVGASDDPTRIGGRPIAYLKRAAGVDLIGVNPRRDSVQGVTCVPSLADLPEPVDVCVFATPAEATVAEIERYAGTAFRAAVVFAGGFAETGAAGAGLQRRLARVARERGVRVLGPNCLGYASISSQVFVTFASAFDHLDVRPGTTALLSQSGGFAINLLVEAAEHGVGLSRMISTGNESDVDLAEFAAFLATDDATDRIMLVMEGIRDGAALTGALAAIRDAGKPGYVLKVGASAVGARSVTSHTALAAGRDGAFDALFERYGITRLHEVSEIVDVMQVSQVPRRAPSMLIATMSGGAAGYMADACSRYGVELAQVSEDGARRLGELLPGFGAVSNPLDVTGQIVNEPGLLRSALSVLAAEQAGITVLFLGGLAQRAESIIDEVLAVRTATATPIAVCWMGVPESVRRTARHRGLLVFDDPARLVRAWAAGHTASAPRPTAGRTGIVGEAEAMRLADQAGIAVPRRRELADPGGLGEVIAAFGGPVVMKVTEPVLAHRAKAGGVALDITSADEARQVWKRFTATLGARRVLVADQLRNDGEVLVGLIRDEVFGVTAVLGSGGVLANETGRHVTLLPPFDADYLAARGQSLPPWDSWTKAYGSEPGFVAELRAILAALGSVLDGHPEITEIELNPVLISDGRLIAADALAITGDGG